MTLAEKNVMLVMIYGLAQVAQLVEQRIENPRVGGSNPPLGTISLPPKSALHQLCWQPAYKYIPAKPKNVPYRISVVKAGDFGMETHFSHMTQSNTVTAASKNRHIRGFVLATAVMLSATGFAIIAVSFL